MTTRVTRTEKLDLRLTAEAKRTLADRRVFQLPPEKWETSVAALDAPPRDLPHLRKLLNEPSVFSDDNRS